MARAFKTSPRSAPPGCFESATPSIPLNQLTTVRAITAVSDSGLAGYFGSPKFGVNVSKCKQSRQVVSLTACVCVFKDLDYVLKCMTEQIYFDYCKLTHAHSFSDSNSLEPLQAGEEVSVILFVVLPGRSRHIPQVTMVSGCLVSCS